MSLSRREMMQLSAAGVLGTSFSGWFNVLATRAAETQQRTTKRCVLLWMDGGPSHKDTWDLRPSREIHAGSAADLCRCRVGIPRACSSGACTDRCRNGHVHRRCNFDRPDRRTSAGRDLAYQEGWLR